MVLFDTGKNIRVTFIFSSVLPLLWYYILERQKNPMNTLDSYALDPPRPLVGVTLVEGPDFQWPNAAVDKITPCPALSFIKAIDMLSVATNPSLELHPPLRTRTFRKNSSLPPRKHTRDSSETRKWREPEGVFKASWYRKHFTELPSVVVCPVHFEPTSNDDEWEKHDFQIQHLYAQAKGQLNGRHCRLVMLCICSRDYSVEQESKERLHLVQERITTLRRHLGVEKAQVQLVYTADLADTSGSATLRKVYKALHAYALDYYKVSSKMTRDHKRGVDSRSGLSFCGQLIMSARHNLKTAIFYEFRGAPASKALKHLETAFGKLCDLAKSYASDIIATGKATGIPVEEVKHVASIINYALCRIRIATSQGPEASLQFQKFTSIYRGLRSLPPLGPVESEEGGGGGGGGGGRRRRGGGRGGGGTQTHSFALLYHAKQWQWLAAQHEIFSQLLSHAKMNGMVLQPQSVGRGSSGKRGSKQMLKKVDPFLLEHTHLANASLAHRRKYECCLLLKRTIACEGGVAVSIDDQKRMEDSE
jgi:hypothetical protein